MAELNENNEKNDNLDMEDTKGGPGERVRKMKQKLEKMVLAMKQPDEDDIDEEVELPKPFLLRKKDNNEKNEDISEFAIKDIFADKKEESRENEEEREEPVEVDHEIRQEIPKEVSEPIKLPPVKKKRSAARSERARAPAGCAAVPKSWTPL